MSGDVLGVNSEAIPHLSGEPQRGPPGLFAQGGASAAGEMHVLSGLRCSVKTYPNTTVLEKGLLPGPTLHG